ncbi:MAG: hypothetical protein GAK43_01200 [Stenotrophomonas maltophilia]|nr:MAG: hypothetical protein GAK43_01200 [Stenotrophomonas maltophilia]
MRGFTPLIRGTGLGLALLWVCSAAKADETAELTAAINAYRGQPQDCAGQAWDGQLALVPEARLALSPQVEDWQAELQRSGYQAAAVQTIRLSGPADAKAAMGMLQSGYCKVLMDAQYVDVGVVQAGSDWRVVLARPLLDGHQGDWQSEGKALLEQINAARVQPRLCGSEPFPAVGKLAWNDALGKASEAHSRAMANGNFLSHRGKDGSLPGDRASQAGYHGQRVGENLAAGLSTATRVVAGWLASPGHCANLMNPMFTELGAAYAVDPQSDAGIYWTLMLGAP